MDIGYYLAGDILIVGKRQLSVSNKISD